MDTRAVNLDRKQLSEFIKSPQTIRAFENLSANSDDYSQIITEIQGASLLALSLSDSLTGARIVTTDGEVEATDGGASGNYTIGLSDTGVTPGTYGSASSAVRVSINAKGRVTLAQQFPLVTGNVAEGTTNLYFTQARARASVSATTPVLYNSGTGVFSLGTVPEANGGTGITSYVAGDIIYATASTALARLGIGANDSVLTSNGSLPSWSATTGTGSVVRQNAPTFNGPPVFPSYTVATAPSASPAAQMAYFSDESGGAVMAFSDGTSWRRVTDRAVIS